MEKKDNYNIQMNVKYMPLEIINLDEILDGCTDKWFNQTLTQVNDSVVRLGSIEGEFHWHKHDDTDEFFFVLEGELNMEIENDSLQTFVIQKNQGITVPKGVLHRPIAYKRVLMLMVESNNIKPEGD